MKTPPSYFKKTIPNYWRRDKNHDYTNRCIYMVTMRKSPTMPDFSYIYAPDGNGYRPKISLSPLGTIIANEIQRLHRDLPSVNTLDYVIMPDHIHCIIYLTEKGKYHLGDVVKRFKGLCSRSWQDAQGLPEDDKPAPVFVYGYHDRYSRDSRHLDRIRKYIPAVS